MSRKIAVTFLATVMAVGAIVIPDRADARYGPGYRPHRMRPQMYRHRPHFYLGGQLMGTAVLAQQLENVGVLGHGGGLGLFAGVRFGRWTALELNWNFTMHNESWRCGPNEWCTDLDFLQIQRLAADFKLHIPTWGPFEPFLQAGGGFAFFGLSGQYGEAPWLYAWGPMFNVGGGVNFWFGPHFSIGGRLLYRGMYFTRSKEYSDIAVEQSADTNYVNEISVDLFASFHF